MDRRMWRTEGHDDRTQWTEDVIDGQKDMTDKRAWWTEENDNRRTWQTEDMTNWTENKHWGRARSSGQLQCNYQRVKLCYWKAEIEAGNWIKTNHPIRSYQDCPISAARKSWEWREDQNIPHSSGATEDFPELGLLLGECGRPWVWLSSRCIHLSSQRICW